MNNLNPPKILTDNGLGILVDTKVLRDYNTPIVEIPLKELEWHFDMPVWELDGTDDWNLTPRQVLDRIDGSNDHWERSMAADLSYPILVTRFNNRLCILDGVHRLVKAYTDGEVVIQGKIIPNSDVEKLLS